MIFIVFSRKYFIHYKPIIKKVKQALVADVEFGIG